MPEKLCRYPGKATVTIDLDGDIDGRELITAMRRRNGHLTVQDIANLLGPSRHVIVSGWEITDIGPGDAQIIQTKVNVIG